MNTARLILSPLAGVLAGGLVIAAIEAIGHGIFPPPPGTNLADPEALQTIMQNAPAGALAAVLVAWFVGVATGVFVARAVHPEHAAWPGWGVAVLLAAGAAVTVIAIPHPTWFLIVTVVVYVVATALGLRLRPASWRPPQAQGHLTRVA